MWAVLVLVLFFNTALSRTLPAIEVCILMIHIFGFFAIFITILYLAPKASAESVFTTFKNQGGWPTQGLSFFVGLSGNAAAFVGADGSVHVSAVWLQTLFIELKWVDVGRGPTCYSERSSLYDFLHAVQRPIGMGNANRFSLLRWDNH